LCGAPVIGRAEDIDHLKTPSVLSSAPLVRVLTAIAGLKARVGDTVPIIAVAISPFSLPVMQMGFDRYLELMHEQPVRFQRLMQLNEDFTVEWANAQLAAGATAICYFDPVSSTTNIPRALYLETGQQVAKRTIARIKGPTATHLASGRGLGIIADIADTGTAVIGVSMLEDLRELKAAAAGRVSLLGNLNGIEMRRWTRRRPNSTSSAPSPGPAAVAASSLRTTTARFPGRCPTKHCWRSARPSERWGRYPLDWIEDWVDPDPT
jgi:uroporphyrinogen decarboxylase